MMQAVFHVLPDNDVLRSIYYNIQTFGLASMCLKEKINSVQAMALLLAQPAFLLLFVLVFWLAARSTRCIRFLHRLQQGRCLVPVLWLIILWSYSSVAFTSFGLLTCVKLRNQNVLFTDGSIECFGRQHLPYAVIAILMMVLFVVALPVLLLLQAFHLHHRLKGFMDEATHIYEDKFRWWSAVNLFRRLIFSALAAASIGREARQTWMVISALLLLFLHASLR